ncbi:sodium/calcium exchanger 3-like [Littorina saxatilis]|uniref:Calx-beta domain-containing protein n=1 Tax=Littorina saxatilis TaxID=31220 RepID=A0AAN9GM79_9CAEN
MSGCSSVGLMLPIVEEESWNKGVRAMLYMLAMLWCFFGVAIVADAFMCGIEHITSKTRKIQIPDPNKKDGVKDIEVKVWNDTVANLSLLAFGTSAPEIMLSCIETIANTFESGELGPGTIVGSAAFNLFMITAICILSIPNGESRRLKNMRVFGVTAFTGLFAYVWLIIVLLGTSPKEVELWEAIVTFMMFPVLILVAFTADKGLGCNKNKTASEVEIGFDIEGGHITGSADIIEVAREFHKETHLSEEETAKIVAAKMMADQPKRSGWYRVNATRKLTGGHKLAPKVNTAFDEIFEKIRAQSNADTVRKMSMNAPDQAQFLDKALVEFTCTSCAVLENEGHVRLGIRRYGNMDKEVKIGVETIDGTAVEGEDYKPFKQLVTFKPNESLRDIFIEIVDDDVWEPDEFFYVKLYHHPEGSSENEVVVGKVAINQVTIVNDDEPGKVEFSKPSYIVKESAERVQLTVNRVNGADGEVMVSWKTKDMSAKAGQEYIGDAGKVIFKHGETAKTIAIGIIGISASEHEPNFQVELSGPTGGAEIGKIPKAIITMINDEEFSSMVTRIAEKTQKNLDGLQLETSSWGEQFYCAMNVNGGDVDSATRVDYVMHFITFFWKVLFAFIPPTSVGGGWLTFGVALAWVGVLTAVIADLASIFGCVVGLNDTITAITFVALGTSMPDTFASRAAALNEKYADSSIGNINGSNAVNVFLGLGLPWLISTIYWKVKGGKLTVNTGSLGFSVTLFAVFALLTMTMLMLRRSLSVFGKAELGGKKIPKIVSAIIIGFFWVIYIIMSSLQAQGVINVGF